ncbi:hypothetical protein P7C70_g4529, partial [Phenoliferia sp. Uapishka_3]
MELPGEEHGVPVAHDSSFLSTMVNDPPQDDSPKLTRPLRAVSHVNWIGRTVECPPTSLCPREPGGTSSAGVGDSTTTDAILHPAFSHVALGDALKTTWDGGIPLFGATTRTSRRGRVHDRSPPRASRTVLSTQSKDHSPTVELSSSAIPIQSIIQGLPADTVLATTERDTTPQLTSPLAVRPTYAHRKTHSGSAIQSSVPSFGIHKRNMSGATRSIQQRSPDLSLPRWTLNDVESLEITGLRVHDFRQIDTAPTPPFAPIASVAATVDDSRSEEAWLASEVWREGMTTDSSSQAHGTSPYWNNHLARSNFGSPRPRHTRTGSKAGQSPSRTHPPLLSTSVPLRRRIAVGISSAELVERLDQSQRDPGGLPLLVIDVRSLSEFLGEEGRIKSSINVNFPPLLTKRFRKGITSNFSLAAFITTEAGRNVFRRTAKRGTLDGVDVVVVDHRPEPRDPASTALSSVLLSVLERCDERGTIYFLAQPFAALLGSSRWRSWIVSGETEGAHEGNIPARRQSLQTQVDEALAIFPGGLFLPSGDPTTLLDPTTNRLSTLELLANVEWRSDANSHNISSETASLPPSSETQSGTIRLRPPKLRQLDTSGNLLLGTSWGVSAQPLPLFVSCTPTDPDPAPPTHIRASRSRADLRIDATASRLLPTDVTTQSLCATPIKSPAAAATRFPEAELVLPATARRAKSASGQVASFVISTIIPGFLYLGSEPTTREDLQQLEDLGVRQILNLAVECDDKGGVLAKTFEKYWKISMRDFVEETGVQRSIEEACKILSDAQLQSKPIYCHCRAGKSRSVTIVLAYLVHQNNWSLKRAYAHVSERRKGISPNIGFVAELMRWEERERGGRSHGVFGSSSPDPAASVSDIATNPSHATSTSFAYFPAYSDDVRQRGARMRDSMPPGVNLADVAGAQGEREMEVRGLDGSWAPARKDARDVNSIPLRRASRAGLESIATGATSWGG